MPEFFIYYHKTQTVDYAYICILLTIDYNDINRYIGHSKTNSMYSKYIKK